MTTVEDPNALGVGIPGAMPARRPAWDFCELAIGYALILAVIWTARPLQRWLYWAAIAWFALVIIRSFPGWKAMGCCAAGFWRSPWVVGVAMILAATAVAFASSLHTLHHPNGVLQWVLAFGGYTVWSLRSNSCCRAIFWCASRAWFRVRLWAAAIAATIFALAHLPNPILTPITLIWGLAACLVFLKAATFGALAMAHAIFGICVAITVPASALHNMRVGRGYLHLSRAAASHSSQPE